jgi:tRNA-dihydrouridine synthase B
MRIGDLELTAPVLLAPMAGVTNAAFRRLCREQGAELTCTEMVMARALVAGNRRASETARVAPDEGPVAVQLCGNDPPVVAEAAHIAQSLGARVIDLNMGCPAPKICRSGCGAALPRDPDRAAAVVSAVARAVPLPVTVKIRSGWDGVTAPETARRLADAGACAVTVHCRTREQVHTGTADWRVAAAVRRAVPASVPVILNGDVADAASAARALRDHGVDGVMVARAALGNPWVFRAVREGILRGASDWIGPDPAERLFTLERHLHMMVMLKGEHIGVLEMRRHAAHYLKALPDTAQARAAIFQASSEAAVRAVIDQVAAAAGVLTMRAG